MSKIKHRSVLYAAIISSIALFSATSALAKDVSLYDQPKADAKVVGNIDLSAGVIPIFTTKQGDWMKVGDPRNGNVGWIKSSDISSSGGPTSFTFTQKTISNGKEPQTYQIIQFGSGQKMTPEQMQVLQQLQQQQQNFQKQWHDLMSQMNDQFQHDWIMPTMGFPVIMPVVVVPARAPVTQPAANTKQPPSAQQK